MSKPDPRIYALVCERLDVRPEETVFMDDADRCVEGALRADLHAIRFQDNAQAIGEVEKLFGSPAWAEGRSGATDEARQLRD